MPENASSKVIEIAKKRSIDLGLPYFGALTPMEVWGLAQSGVSITIVDVRTRAEWVFVGHVPESIKIEWQHFPSGALNPNFITTLKDSVNMDSNIVFMCRSGARSNDAAILAASEGFPRIFNMLEGFEGDLDPNGHRNKIGGWRAAGLAWQQS